MKAFVAATKAFVAATKAFVAATKRDAARILLPERAKWNETGNHAFVTCQTREPVMNNIIYIVGLVVVVLAVLSFFGLR